MSRSKSAVMEIAMKIAEEQTRRLVAEQTAARIHLGFDAALIAAHEALDLGPGRAAAFRDAWEKAIEELASLFVDDGADDQELWTAKHHRDQIIRNIVGDELFVPFDEAYGAAYMDELRRIRMRETEKNGGEGHG